jgi:hypothetical protein
MILTLVGQFRDNRLPYDYFWIKASGIKDMYAVTVSNLICRKCIRICPRNLGRNFSKPWAFLKPSAIRFHWHWIGRWQGSDRPVYPFILDPSRHLSIKVFARVADRPSLKCCYLCSVSFHVHLQIWPRRTSILVSDALLPTLRDSLT